MESILDFMKGFDFKTILSMTFIMWYFTRGIKKSVTNIGKGKK